MICPDPVQLDAFVDAELPAAQAAALTRHLEECPVCAARVRGTRRLSALLRREAGELGEEFDPGRLLAAVKQEVERRAEARRRWRQGLVAAAAAAALAAGTMTYRASREDRLAMSEDAFALALLKEHRGYVTSLGADREFNIQVAQLEE